MQTHTKLTPAELAAAIRAVDVDALASDSRADLPGGYRLAVELEPDYDFRIDDIETLGRFEWKQSGTGRPPGFDGSAEIVERERGECLWWLPFRYGGTVYNSEADRRTVLRYLREGCVCVGLTLHGPAVSILEEFHCRLASYCIGGVESWDWERILPDLVAELAAEVEAAAAP